MTTIHNGFVCNEHTICYQLHTEMVYKVANGGMKIDIYLIVYFIKFLRVLFYFVSV